MLEKVWRASMFKKVKWKKEVKNLQVYMLDNPNKDTNLIYFFNTEPIGPHLLVKSL